MTAAIVRWEQPPPRAKVTPTGGVAGSQWDQVAKELIARPGQWALIREGVKQGTAASLAGLIRRGAVVCFEPRGDFDAVTRSVRGVASVYARYVGDGGAW